MALRPYIASSDKFDNYYAAQMQRGQIGGALPAYGGTRIQRGRGIGGIFRKLIRRAVPYVAPVLKTIGHQAVAAAGDVLTGKQSVQSATQSVKAAAKRGVKRTLTNAAVSAMRQRGGGRKRRKHSGYKGRQRGGAKRRKTGGRRRRTTPKQRRRRTRRIAGESAVADLFSG